MPNYPYDDLSAPLDTTNLERLNNNYDQIQADIQSVSSASTIAVNALETEIDGKLLAQKNELGGRLDVQKTIIENLVVEGDSSPEAALARVGFDGTNYPTLKARIDTEMLEKPSGSPKGVYATLSALQAAKPTGDNFTYVVTADGKWYYWNGTAWTSGGFYQTTLIKDAVKATNLINNGNFVGTTFWDAVSSANGTLSSSNNELIYTVVGLVSTSRIQQNGVYSPVAGHKYYVRGDIFPKVANTSYISFGGVDSSIVPTINAWNKISRVITAANTTAFRYYHPTNTGYVAGDTVKFRRMIAVDLTVLYGAGNEPSLAEFEITLSQFVDSWFDGIAVITPPVYLTEQVLNEKVDREEGKVLSSNDFTDSYKEAIDAISNKVIVNASDFPTLRAAMNSIIGLASASSPYELRIDEGEYDLLSMYTQAEIENTSFVGFVVPDYVSLKGTGRKEATILRMEIPNTWLPATIARVAPVAYQGNGGMENLTVIGRNARYTVHDDYGFPDSVKVFKNCSFVKLAGLGNSQAWGEGSFSGMQFHFEDCEFITEYSQAPYSTHNNLDFEKPSYHRFKNCRFENKGGYFGVRFITLASGVVDRVDMEGCYIDGIIKCEEYEPGDGCLFDIHMHSCSQVPILIDATDGSQPTYDIIEETKIYRNAETTTITKGTPVMFNNDGSVILRLGTNSTTLMIGVALEDIPTLEKGTVKTGGYLPVVDTGLTLVKGDKVGVVGGSLAKVTAGDFIGVVTRNGFIKLKF